MGLLVGVGTPPDLAAGATLVEVGTVLLAFLFLVIGLRGLLRARRRVHHGWLSYIDLPATSELRPRELVSTSLRLRGRPDEVRVDSAGRPVPVEFKSRRSPATGPFLAHRTQALAYALLLEESVGRTPPYVVVRYGDGGEFVLPWNQAMREEVLRTIALARSRYDGRATPSPGKCRSCTYVSICDARVV